MGASCRQRGWPAEGSVSPAAGGPGGGAAVSEWTAGWAVGESEIRWTCPARAARARAQQLLLPVLVGSPACSPSARALRVDGTLPTASLPRDRLAGNVTGPRGTTFPSLQTRPSTHACLTCEHLVVWCSVSFMISRPWPCCVAPLRAAPRIRTPGQPRKGAGCRRRPWPLSSEIWVSLEKDT